MARGGGYLPAPVMRARGPRPAPTAPYVVGVDTIGISFPIADDFDRESVGTVITERITESGVERRYRRQLDGGGFLGLGVGGAGWLEFSAPKRVGETNVYSVQVPELVEIVDVAIAEARQFCTPLVGSVEDVTVKRLDLVRDFDGVTKIPQLLDALSTVRQAGRVKTARYADATNNRAETLRAGVKSAWGARLYDKHAQTKEFCAGCKAQSGARVDDKYSPPIPPATAGKRHVRLDLADLDTPELRAEWGKEVGRRKTMRAGVPHTCAEPGRLRYEAQLRDEALRSVFAVKHGGAVDALAAVEGAKLERLGRAWFDRVGFGREVFAMDRLVDRVFSIDELSDREKRELWCYVTARSFGAELGYSVPTARKYERLCQEHRIICAPAELGCTVALDFDRGEEVLKVA